MQFYRTCESNSLLLVVTSVPSPFSRLLDPGGQCRYMSDKPGCKRTATKHPHAKMLLMTCTCELKETINKIMKALVPKETLDCVIGDE